MTIPWRVAARWHDIGWCIPSRLWEDEAFEFSLHGMNDWTDL